VCSQYAHLSRDLSHVRLEVDVQPQTAAACRALCADFASNIPFAGAAVAFLVSSSWSGLPGHPKAAQHGLCCFGLCCCIHNGSASFAIRCSCTRPCPYSCSHSCRGLANPQHPLFRSSETGARDGLALPCSGSTLPWACSRARLAQHRAPADGRRRQAPRMLRSAAEVVSCGCTAAAAGQRSFHAGAGGQEVCMGMPAARLLTALVTLCWTVPDKHSGAAWPAARCRRALGVRAAVSAPEWPDALGRWLGRRPRRQGAHRADRKAELQTLLACNCIPAALLRVLRESSAVRAQTADCARQVLTAVGRRASFPEASGACGGPLAARGRGRDQGALSGPVPDTPAGRHRFPSCAARRAETFASELSGVGARPAGRRADAGAAGAGRQVRGRAPASDDSFFNSFIKGDLPQRIGTVLVRPPGGCGCARRDRPAPTASCSRARTRESLRGERDQGGLCCPRVAPYIRSSQAGSGALAACWRR